MTTQSPRIDKGQFEFSHQVYYGTDDGFKRLGSLEEEARHDAAHVAGLYKIFARYENFHQRVAPDRRANIHLASVVGGLYGLNLIPLFRPKEITFFDVNPHAVIYFTIIRRVWIDSRSAAEFLAKLASADYEADTPEEREIRACLAARQNGTLTEDRGQPARTLLSSWRYALDHFELTQQFLAEVPVHTRVEDMRSSDFAHFVATHQNLWIFCSNVIVFAFFDLRFQYPQNAAVFGSYFDRTEMLDLGGSGGEPVTVHCRFPMSVSIEDRTVNHRWHYNIL